MKKTMVRMLTLLLALVLLCGLTACAGGNGDASGNTSSPQKGETGTVVAREGYPVVTEAVTLKVAAPYGAAYKPIDEYQLVQEYKEKTGIDIEWNLVPDTEWGEKKPLLLASADLPDVILGGLSDTDVLDNADTGNFMMLDTLLEEYAPNLQEVFALRPDYKALWTSLDGHSYQIGRSQEMFGLTNTHGIHWINKDWLDAASLSVPTTIEEYESVLKTLVAADPNGNGKADEFGLSFIDGEANAWRNHGGPGALFGAFGMADTGDHIAVQDGNVILTANTDAYRQGVQWLRSLYEQGLIDPDSFSQTEPQMTAKGSAENEVFISFIDWDAYQTVGTERADSYVAVPPLLGPAGEKLWSRENVSEASRNAAVITKNCANPEAAMRWLDYGFEPKVSARINWGEVGSMFDENADGMLTYRDVDAIWETTLEGTPHVFPRAILDEYYDKYYEYPPDATYVLGIREETYFDYVPEEYYPELMMSSEDATQLATYALAINSIIDERRAVWITTGGIEEEWEDYLSQLEQAGLSRYLEIKQQYYDGYLENLG